MSNSLSLSIILLACTLSSAALAASAVLGVDLGTEYIKATIVKPGIPLDIVLTKDSRRKELSAVAFKPEKNVKSSQFPERFFGSDAIALASRFPEDVYPNLKSLLGIGTENPIVKEYSLRHPKLRIITEKVGRSVVFQSNAFSEKESMWTVEEILAMELQNVQKNAQAMAGKGTTIKDVVITIPPFFTIEEKRAVFLAADLAGLQILELVSDGLAVGINYATSRTFSSINDGGRAETHLIFDMGAGSTKASVLRFQGKTIKDVGKFNKTVQEIKVLGSGWDKTFGANFLNSVIIDDIVSQFISSSAAQKKNINADTIKSNGKVAAKLQRQAENIRKILSANVDTQYFFEELYEEIDFKYKITRAEFEKLIEDDMARISVTIQKSLDNAGLAKDNLDSVILHGGVSRTPFVQKEIENFFGDTSKLKTNVNSDESAVFGAGFRAATLSPSFRVKEIRVSDCLAYAVGVKWTNTHNKVRDQVLWDATSFIGDEKHYTFKNQNDPFVITFYQRIPTLENSSSSKIDHEILTASTQNLTNSVTFLKEKYGCTESMITVRLNAQILAESGEVNISKLVVGCESDISEEKGSMVDSVKGIFGYGKKDQAPLSDGEISESTTSTSKIAESLSATIMTESSPSSTENTSQQSSIRAHKVFHNIPLDFTTEIKGRSQLSAPEISRMKDRLAAFSSSDNLRRLRDEALNQLESFTYKVRDSLDDSDFIVISTEKERANLELKSKDLSDWIYSGGTEASREELRQKLKELTDIMSPIEFRKKEIATRPEKVLALQNALSETKQIISSITEQISNNTRNHDPIISNSGSQASTKSQSSSPEEHSSPQEEKPKITEPVPIELSTSERSVYTEADLTNSQKLYDEFSAWLEEKIVSQKKLNENDDPILLSKDLEEKIKILQDTNIQLLIKNLRNTYNQTSSNRTRVTKSHDNKAEEERTAEDSSKTTNIPKGTFTEQPDKSKPDEEKPMRKLEKHDSQNDEAKLVESDNYRREKEENPKHVEL